MARINQFEALCDDLHREAVKKGIAVKKVVKAKPSRLAKSAPGSLADFFKAAKGGVRIVASESAKPGTKLAVQGGKVVKPAKAGPGENAEPPEHPGIRAAKAISEMRTHAIGKAPNSRVTPEQLDACRLLARTGRLDPSEVDNVEKALNDGRALPSWILRKLGSGNA